MHLYDLPSVVLELVGSFLPFMDCIKAARTCKNNKNLQPVLSSVTEATIFCTRDMDEIDGRNVDGWFKAQARAAAMCPAMQVLVIISGAPLSSLEPLHSSRDMISSLKVLKVGLRGDSSYNRFVMELSHTLPFMEQLEEFHLLLGHETELPSESEWEGLLASLPQSLHAIAFNFLDVIMLKHLAMLITRDRLPFLTELYLSYMDINLHDAEYLGLALISPCAARLKTLLLHTDPDGRSLRQSWGILSTVLGLSTVGVHDKESYLSEVLPCLRELTLGPLDWLELGNHLLQRRSLFPQLVECRFTEGGYDSDVNFCEDGLDLWIEHEWYEQSEDATRIWLKVLQERRLKPWHTGSVFFDSAFAEDEEVYDGDEPTSLYHLVKELFVGLSQPESSRIACSLKRLHLQSLDLDAQLQNSLAAVIGSGTLSLLEHLGICLKFGGRESFANLGRAMKQTNLPVIKSLLLEGGSSQYHSEKAQLLCWETFFSAIGGLSNIEHVAIGTSCESHLSSLIFGALSSLKSSALFHQVSVLNMLGHLRSEDLVRFSTALSSGVFPSLQVLHFDDIYVQDEMAEELQVFLNVLGRCRTLKVLSFGDWHCSSQAGAFIDGLTTFFTTSQGGMKYFCSLEVIDLGWCSCNCQGGRPKLDIAVKRFHDAIKQSSRPGKLDTLLVGLGRLSLT